MTALIDEQRIETAPKPWSAEDQATDDRGDRRPSCHPEDYLVSRLHQRHRPAGDRRCGAQSRKRP